MSKKLESILGNYSKATVSNPSLSEQRAALPEEKIVRINAEVPFSLKTQIKEYIAKNPGETEKTVMLKALRSFGLNGDEKYLSDLRGRS
jgi:hypothetical protein